MAATDNGTSAAINGGIVETPLPATPSKAAITTTNVSNQNKSTRRLCFAPTEQAHNHGSDRARPLRTMPFNPEIWIGNLEDLGRRVWPHPSYKELIARSATGDPKFALPHTVAKENRFQSLRLRCCGDGCDQTTHSPDVEYEKPSRLEMLAFGQTQNVRLLPNRLRDVAILTSFSRSSSIPSIWACQNSPHHKGSLLSCIVTRLAATGSGRLMARITSTMVLPKEVRLCRVQDQLVVPISVVWALRRNNRQAPLPNLVRQQRLSTAIWMTRHCVLCGRCAHPL